MEEMDYLRNGFPYNIDESKSSLELAVAKVPQFIITAKEMYDQLNICMQEIEVSWDNVADFIIEFDSILKKHGQNMRDLYEPPEGDEVPEFQKMKDGDIFWNDIESMETSRLFSPYEGMYLAAYNLWSAIDHEYRGFNDEAEHFLRVCATINMKDDEWIRHPENEKRDKILKAIYAGAKKGGKVTHSDKDLFLNDYRDARDNVGGSRAAIVGSLSVEYCRGEKENPAKTSLESWAKEADKEDGFTRKAGRPSKNNG